MRLRWLALCLLAVVAAQGARAVTIRLTDADGLRVQAALHPGDVLRVDLPSEPAGGQRWSLAGHLPVQLLELGTAQRIYGGRLSNQGTSSFAWRAANAGEAEVTLIYGAPYAGEAKAARSWVLHVTVAGQPLGPEEAHPAPVSQMELVETWQRALPCGDCSSLTETLMLYRAPGEAPFVLRRIYTDAPGGSLTSIATGRWSTATGTYADPAATIYVLSDSGEGVTAYRLTHGTLVQLDAQQIPVPAPPGMDTAFHRRPQP